MKYLTEDDLKNIDLIKLTNFVINDDKLGIGQKVSLLKDRKSKLYNGLKYHKVTDGMKKDMKACIKYIEDWLHTVKLNK